MLAQWAKENGIFALWAAFYLVRFPDPSVQVSRGTRLHFIPLCIGSPYLLYLVFSNKPPWQCFYLSLFCKDVFQQALGGGLPEDAEESAKWAASPTKRCQTLTIKSNSNSSNWTESNTSGNGPIWSKRSSEEAADTCLHLMTKSMVAFMVCEMQRATRLRLNFNQQFSRLH